MMKFAPVLLSALLLVGCSSKKEVAQLPPPEPPKPSWLQQRPLESGYYIGIGMAPKTSSGEYIQQAKNNALNDLASEISVQVSSTSFLYQMEQDSRFREDFGSDTRTRSKAFLEGYELVDTYESSREYWVLYRLSRLDHKTLTDQRRAQAVALARAKLQDAVRFSTGGKSLQALTACVSALQALQDFWGEPIEAEWNGQTVYLSNEIFLQIQKLWEGLEIVPAKAQLKVKRGDQPDRVVFGIADAKGVAQPNLPTTATYSGARLRTTSYTTNASGSVEVELPRISSVNAEEQLTLALDVDQLVSQTAAGSAVGAILKNLPTPVGLVRIEISKPKIFLKGSEANLNQALSPAPLKEAFGSLLIQEGFDLVKKSDHADLVVEIDANTTQAGVNGEFFSCNLIGTIKTFRPDGKAIHTVSLEGIKGVQLSATQAGMEAYRKGADEVNRRYFRDWRRQLFD